MHTFYMTMKQLLYQFIFMTYPWIDELIQFNALKLLVKTLTNNANESVKN